MFSLTIPGPCVPKARPRTKTLLREDALGFVSKARTWGYTPAKSKEYAERATWLAKEAKSEQGWVTVPKSRPVKVWMTFWMLGKGTARPDIFNMEMQIADVLQAAGIYEDDSQVVEVKSLKARLSSAPATMVYVAVLG